MVHVPRQNIPAQDVMSWYPSSGDEDKDTDILCQYKYGKILMR